MILCGVVVKYHPCSLHARQVPCLHFQKQKKCNKTPLKCETPEYDRWYRDVLDGNRKCFYPNKILLLEHPGVPMFLFHVHHHALLGEAEILEATEKEGKHFYWFEEFILYSNPVQLELIQTDHRLPRLATRGRWRCINIGEATINEIRRLSELSEQQRKNLGRDLERIIYQMKKWHARALKTRGPTWDSYMNHECKKLDETYGLSEQILAKTQEYFTDVIQKKIFIGYSYVDVFYASLYLAFRTSGKPKLHSDISKISDVGPTKLRKLCSLLTWKLELTVPPLSPKQLIISRSDKLRISRNTIRRAMSLVEEAKKRRITQGRAPSSVAASAIFVACQKEGEDIKQVLIAKVFDVSTVTIRNYSRKLQAL